MLVSCFSTLKLRIVWILSQLGSTSRMAAKEPPPSLALVDLHPDTSKLTIQFTLGGKRRAMERNASEQLKSCLNRMQLNLIEKKDRKKKGPEKVSPQSLPRAELLFQSQPVLSELTHLEAWKDGSVLRVGTEEFLVRYNTPRVLSISLPRHTFVGCPVVPQVELSHCDSQHCHWVWWRVQDPAFSEEAFSAALPHDATELSEQTLDTFQLVRLSDKSIYSPRHEDVGRRLLLLVFPSHLETGAPGICSYCTTVSEVRPAPSLEGQVDRFVDTRQPTDTHHLRVMSYNVSQHEEKQCRANTVSL